MPTIIVEDESPTPQAKPSAKAAPKKKSSRGEHMGRLNHLRAELELVLVEKEKLLIREASLRKEIDNLSSSKVAVVEVPGSGSHCGREAALDKSAPPPFQAKPSTGAAAASAEAVATEAADAAEAAAAATAAAAPKGLPELAPATAPAPMPRIASRSPPRSAVPAAIEFRKDMGNRARSQSLSNKSRSDSRSAGRQSPRRSQIRSRSRSRSGSGSLGRSSSYPKRHGSCQGSRHSRQSQSRSQSRSRIINSGEGGSSRGLAGDIRKELEPTHAHKGRSFGREVDPPRPPTMVPPSCPPPLSSGSISMVAPTDELTLRPPAAVGSSSLPEAVDPLAVFFENRPRRDLMEDEQRQSGKQHHRRKQGRQPQQQNTQQQDQRRQEEQRQPDILADLRKESQPNTATIEIPGKRQRKRESRLSFRSQMHSIAIVGMNVVGGGRSKGGGKGGCKADGKGKAQGRRAGGRAGEEVLAAQHTISSRSRGGGGRGGGGGGGGGRGKGRAKRRGGRRKNRLAQDDRSRENRPSTRTSARMDSPPSAAQSGRRHSTSSAPKRTRDWEDPLQLRQNCAGASPSLVLERPSSLPPPPPPPPVFTSGSVRIREGKRVPRSGTTQSSTGLPDDGWREEVHSGRQRSRSHRQYEDRGRWSGGDGTPRDHQSQWASHEPPLRGSKRGGQRDDCFDREREREQDRGRARDHHHHHTRDWHRSDFQHDRDRHDQGGKGGKSRISSGRRHARR